MSTKTITWRRSTTPSTPWSARPAPSSFSKRQRPLPRLADAADLEPEPIKEAEAPVPARAKHAVGDPGVGEGQYLALERARHARGDSNLRRKMGVGTARGR